MSVSSNRKRAKGDWTRTSMIFPGAMISASFVLLVLCGLLAYQIGETTMSTIILVLVLVAFPPGLFITWSLFAKPRLAIHKDIESIPESVFPVLESALRSHNIKAVCIKKDRWASGFQSIFAALQLGDGSLELWVVRGMRFKPWSWDSEVFTTVSLHQARGRPASIPMETIIGIVNELQFPDSDTLAVESPWIGQLAEMRGLMLLLMVSSLPFILALGFLDYLGIPKERLLFIGSVIGMLFVIPASMFMILLLMGFYLHWRK